MKREAHEKMAFEVGKPKHARQKLLILRNFVHIKRRTDILINSHFYQDNKSPMSR